MVRLKATRSTHDLLSLAKAPNDDIGPTITIDQSQLDVDMGDHTSDSKEENAEITTDPKEGGLGLEDPIQDNKEKEQEVDNDNEQDESSMEIVEEGNSQEAVMTDAEAGGVQDQEGKRVKVYELRDASWFDRGTGHCKGVYDDAQDIALLIVEREESPDRAGESGEGEGGFLKDELLLTARVEKEDIYSRQQDTLIVWTEPATQLDIALSFQDADGCEDIWQFIMEVQRHFGGMPSETDPNMPSSSSPLSASPVLGVGSSQLPLGESRSTWEPPSLANIKQQEMWIRMQAKSGAGRERAIEHIIREEYIRQLIVVFDQAEDLESLDDLHALCSLMQTILMFNDNAILEYILQDNIFMGVIGIFEYDPDFPSLKASYRQFFEGIANFRQVVEIRDPNIQNKIHQLFRVQFLRDVVLARMLDDGTFGILNGFVFFTQADIINHIQTNDAFLVELLSGFKEEMPGTPDPNQPLDERRRNIVLLLNQLMILGKGVQLPNRLALYRNLIDRGLLFVCEWAFRRSEAQLLHAGAEILTLAVEHDVNVVRAHILKEHEAKRRTLIVEMIGMLNSTKNLGLLSQTGDSLRTLLDTTPDDNSYVQRKEGPISENFLAYFYEYGIGLLYKPLLDLPEIKPSEAPVPKLSREQAALLHLLIELLSTSILNQSQSHRASYYILSNPISRKIVSLLYVKEKPLKHSALRFIRSCLRTPNHFIHRHFVKNDLLAPFLDLLEAESVRDNMLSSSCMEILDIIRKENIKPIINYLFDNYRSRIETLNARPFLRAFVHSLTLRWEINNEPPPPPVQPDAESSSAWTSRAAAEEENYFNLSDEEEEIGPKPPAPVSPQKRKRMVTHGGGIGPPAKRPSAPSPGKMTRGAKGGGDATAGASGSGGGSGGSALGLDYDDGSDSDGSSGTQSPVIKWLESDVSEPAATAKADEELEEDLSDVAMKMRAKRQREEEEEEGFAGLIVGKGGGGGKKEEVKKDDSPTAQTVQPSPQKDKEKESEKEGGKKIKLSFSSLGKKLAGGGSR